MKREQAPVALGNIKANATLQLAQVYRAEVKRPVVCFLDVIRSVHQTAVPNAVLNSKHVTRFMRKHLAAAPQDQPLRIGSGFAIELRIVPRKAINAHSLPQRGLAEYKIPLRVRIEIYHRDTKQGECIIR